MITRRLPHRSSLYFLIYCMFLLLLAFSVGAQIENHDVGLVNFSNSVNNIKIEHQNGSIVFGDQLQCNEKYKIIIKVKNFGEFVENVTFNGSIGQVLFNHLPLNNFNPGDTSEKSRTVNVSLTEGNYNIRVDAQIPDDINLSNNFAARPIEVICGEASCNVNSDCGVDGFIGDNYCTENKVTHNFISFTCNNPGTLQSFCSQTIEERVIEECSSGCNNGVCVSLSCGECKVAYKENKRGCSDEYGINAGRCKKDFGERVLECDLLVDNAERKLCQTEAKVEASECKREAKNEKKECTIRVKEQRESCLAMCVN